MAALESPTAFVELRNDGSVLPDAERAMLNIVVAEGGARGGGGRHYLFILL